MASTGSYPWVAHQPVSTAAPRDAGVADRREHLGRGALRMVLEAEPHAVRVEHFDRPVTVRVDDASEAGDQVDVEVVREAARRLHVGGRAPDASREADDPNPVAREGLTRDCDVLWRRPAPVEVCEPEVDRVVADVGDRGEEGVEALGKVSSGSNAAFVASSNGPHSSLRRSRAPWRRSSRS